MVLLRGSIHGACCISSCGESVMGVGLSLVENVGGAQPTNGCADPHDAFPTTHDATRSVYGARYILAITNGVP